jgi:uncharacterized protein YhbP (UPF0306 family)
MEARIRSFLQAQKNLTLCTAVDHIPHCASCFYSFEEKIHFLFFKSGRETQHILNAFQNEAVAGTVVPDRMKTGTIKGIQFTGGSGSFMTTFWRARIETIMRNFLLH